MSQDTIEKLSASIRGKSEMQMVRMPFGKTHSFALADYLAHRMHYGFNFVILAPHCSLHVSGFCTNGDSTDSVSTRALHRLDIEAKGPLCLLSASDMNYEN